MKKLSAVYVLAICLANYLIFVFGPWVSVINSFLLIGLDFVIRDKLHERLGIAKVSCLAIAAGLISYLINPSALPIAVASSVSFVLASLADGAVYQSLIKRRWLIKSNASNAGGAAVDSLLFPLIAFGAFIPEIVAGQFIAKIGGGGFWALALNKVKGEQK